jgi:hypothetical protein
MVNQNGSRGAHSTLTKGIFLYPHLCVHLLRGPLGCLLLSHAVLSLGLLANGGVQGLQKLLAIVAIWQ